MRIGIDNYGLYPLGLDPIQTLQWALDNGAEGVAFSGIDDKHRSKCSPGYLKRLAGFASDNNLYLEWGGVQHIPRNMQTWERKELFEINKRSVEEAQILGARIIRSCSGGLMRWDPNSITTKELMEETAEELKCHLQLFRDTGMILAIETHFEFTTFELLRIFEWCGVYPGDCLGICLDTMNLLTMLEDPVSATDRILPWVVSTHIKDGAIINTDHGMKSFTCRVGDGIIDLKAIIAKLKGLDGQINLSIEDHGGEFELPIFDPRFLMEFPDLSNEELNNLKNLAKDSDMGMEKGTCLPLPREEWSDHCEQRMISDIDRLRGIVNG